MLRLQLELLATYFYVNEPNLFVARLNELAFLLTGSEINSDQLAELKVNFYHVPVNQVADVTFKLVEDLHLTAHTRFVRGMGLILYFTVNERYRQKYLASGFTERYTDPRRLHLMNKKEVVIIEDLPVRSKMLDNISVPHRIPKYQPGWKQRKVGFAAAVLIAMLGYLFGCQALAVWAAPVAILHIRSKLIRTALCIAGAVLAYFTGGFALVTAVVVVEISAMFFS